MNSDNRIIEIQKEIRQTGKSAKTAAEWKAYFRTKGYSDDECDLAYVLADVKINYGPFSPTVMIVLFVLLAVGIMRVAFSPPLGFLPLMFYCGYIIVKRGEVFQKVLAADFEAELTSLPETNYLKKWQDAGSLFLNHSRGNLGPLLRCTYDQRETYFGTYSYTVGSGKHKHTYYYFIVVQKLNRPLPQVQCNPESLFGRGIRMESGEFNKRFKITAAKEIDAYYVLNPRVMDKILQEDAKQKILAFETLGDYVLIGLPNLSLTGKFHLSDPVVRYEEYQKVKVPLLNYLDLATNLNDTLAREIIDSGTNRSAAKLQ